MTDDTLTRVRAALARLAEVEARATPGPWECSHGGYIGTAGTASGPHVLTGYEFDIDDADAVAIVALRNAAGPLLALAEAVAEFRASVNVTPSGWITTDGAGLASDAFAVAIDAALAALADATTGEVQ